MRPPMVYVAGPYTATTEEKRDENVRRARDISNELWLRGYAVICPHMNTYGFEGDASVTGEGWQEAFKMFLLGDFEFISRCDAVIMLPGWDVSRGACAEFVFAHWMGIPVYHWPDVPCPREFCDEMSEV